MYVEELIGPDTVTTIPPATLDAFRSHGQVSSTTVTAGVDESESRAFEASSTRYRPRRNRRRTTGGWRGSVRIGLRLRPSWSRTKEAVYSQWDAVQNCFLNQLVGSDFRKLPQMAHQCTFSDRRNLRRDSKGLAKFVASDGPRIA